MDPSAAPHAPRTVAVSRQGLRIDVHKKKLVACLRQQDGRRTHAEVQSFGTPRLRSCLHAWLSGAGCTHVAKRYHLRRLEELGCDVSKVTAA